MKSAARIALLTVVLPFLTARASTYLDNPLMEKMLIQRYHVIFATPIDTASNDHDRFSLLGGLGLCLDDHWAAGVYGSYRRSDRLFPKRMKSIHGFGVYGEYTLTPQAAIQPFAGARFGFIDTSGPSYPTSLTAAGILGARVPLSENLSLFSSLVLGWSQEELLDWTDDVENVPGSGSRTDLSVEIGLRLRF